MKKVLLIMMVIAVLLVGCTDSAIKENEIYKAPKEEENANKQLDVDKQETKQQEIKQKVSQANDTIVHVTKDNKELLDLRYNIRQKLGDDYTVITSDSQYVYVQKIIRRDGNSVIGDQVSINFYPTILRYMVQLIRLDLKSYQEDLIAQSIPFVTQNKWSPDNSKIAFIGDKHLTVYDVDNNKLILDNYLRDEKVIEVGWSKDSKKLYIEDSEPLNSVCYVDSGKILRAYQNDEQFYPREKINDEYYIAAWDQEESISYAELNKNDNKYGYRPVILNNKNEIIKVFPKGRFKQLYNQSMIMIGEYGFGLYYFKDINQPDQFECITEKYVYDAMIVEEDKLIVITDNSAEGTGAVISMYGENNKLEYYDYSLGTEMILCNNKIVRTNYNEQLDYKYKIFFLKQADRPKSVEPYKDMGWWDVLAGGIKMLYKCKITGYLQKSKLSYFKDYEPTGMAYTEVTNMISDEDGSGKLLEYIIKADTSYDKTTHNDLHHTQVLKIYTKNAEGRSILEEVTFELDKINGKWYITGMCTYPNSQQRNEVTGVVANCIDSIKSGKIKTTDLKGKDMTIGQIQFWKLSMPHLAVDVSTSNYAKVYLKVVGEKKIYKLIVEKKTTGKWRYDSIKLAEGKDFNRLF